MRKLKIKEEALTPKRRVEMTVFLKMIVGMKNEMESSDWETHSELFKKLIRGLTVSLEETCKNEYLKGRKLDLTGKMSTRKMISISNMEDKSAFIKMKEIYLSNHAIWVLKECDWNNTLPDNFLKTIVTIIMGMEYLIFNRLCNKDQDDLYNGIMELCNINNWLEFERKGNILKNTK